MQPNLTFDQAKTELVTMTSQTGHFTFTDDEITQALEQAWGDTYVIKQVWDESLSYVPGTWKYAIPATVNVVKGLYFKRSLSDNPEPLSSDLYEVVDGKIQFTNNVNRWLSDTYTIYIKGSYKITLTDVLPSTNLVNYVLNLAAEVLLTRLLLKRTFVFLTNDTSVQEISAALQQIQGQVLRYKQALLREFEAI